jgi:hypothetical protein
LTDFFFPATADWLQAALLRSSQMIHLSLRGMQYDVARRSAN